MKRALPNYSDDKELLRAFRDGEQGAFVVIYERFWNRIFLIAYRSTRSKEVAEDLVQNLFLKLWEKRDILNIQQLESYLYSSIKYSVIDYVNNQLVKGKYLDHVVKSASHFELATDLMVEASELSELIEKGLTQLPEKSRNIFRMNKFENWPTNKIAEKFNISEKAVQYHLTKSLKTMRVYLKSISLSLLLFIVS